MTDTARVLLTAAVLSGSAVGVFAWRLSQLDASSPDRVVGELRLAQFAALLLAVAAGISAGLAIGAEAVPTAHLDLTLALGLGILAGVVLRLEPRDGLSLVAVGFLLHALVNVAHRPGWLSPDVATRGEIIGSAIYDVYVAALCYWARRR